MLISNGPAIKALREAQGWTGVAFAHACDISHSHLFNIEHPDRRQRATGQLLDTMSALLEVPVAVIAFDPESASIPRPRRAPAAKASR